MNAPAKITASLDAATVALVDRLAKARGMSGADYAAEAIRRVAETEADYAAFLQVGIDQLDRGEGIPHEQVMADLDAMIAQRRAQCRT
jgi:predicted transcriptional regulator